MRRWSALLCLLLILSAVFPPASAVEQDLEAEVSLYVGYVSRELNVYRSPDESSQVLGRLPKDVHIDVYDKKRTFTKVGYGDLVGYALTKHVERVQYRDPFAGPMPGVIPQVAVVRLARNAQFKPEEYNYPISVQEGALISVRSIDDKKVTFSYMRLEDPMSLPLDVIDDIEYVVPWEEAQPGDLIGAFSTFYSVSTKRELNVGRVYNIELAVSRLNGHRIAPGEVFSYNEICAPYTQENGYKQAPILASDDRKVGFGGGVCQVSTTLYNVALRVPSWIVDMHWHGQGGVKYIPAGFDATVSDKWDMSFENVLPYTIEIRYGAYDGVMTARFYRAQEE